MRAGRVLVAMAAASVLLAGCGDDTDGLGSDDYGHAAETVTAEVEGPHGSTYFCVIAARDSGGGGIWCDRLPETAP